MTSQEIILFICKGFSPAERLLTVLHEYVHLLDDLADLDMPLTAERIARVSHDLIKELTFNEFYLAHKQALFPLVVQAWNAWTDATDWEHSDNLILKRDADVLKSFYHEIFFQVAYIIGGYRHLRAVTPKVREYDHDNLTNEEKENGTLRK